MSELDHPETTLRSLKLIYANDSVHDQWYLVQWDCRGELHEAIMPARYRDEALKFVQDRLQALKVNGSGRWSARELGFGPWRLSFDGCLPVTGLQFNDDEILPAQDRAPRRMASLSKFWPPEMLTRAEAAELNSIPKIRAAFDREIHRLDTLQQRFEQWVAWKTEQNSPIGQGERDGQKESVDEG